jgi:hypothetical protein
MAGAEFAAVAAGWGSMGGFDLKVVEAMLDVVLVDTPGTPAYHGDITEEGGGPVEMNSGSDCNIHPTREVIDC